MKKVIIIPVILGLSGLSLFRLYFHLGFEKGTMALVCVSVGFAWIWFGYYILTKEREKDAKKSLELKDGDYVEYETWNGNQGTSQIRKWRGHLIIQELYTPVSLFLAESKHNKLKKVKLGKNTRFSKY